MKHKRVVAFIVILALIISALPAVGLAEETSPSIEVIGSTIKNDNEFFELTMKVTPASEGFFSAGMTLKYDKSVITPVSWDKSGTAVPMTDCTNWQNVAAVPAVCPAEISGKTALAYEDADNGYMYISAETALPVKAIPNEGKILTVRFKYAGSDETAKAVSKNAVISGFATENGEKIVSLAPDKIAAESPAGQMVFYGAGDEDETEYYYTTETPTAGISHDKPLTDAPKFTLNENAESANTGGGSDASDFAALVFFDWDESTLLGSMVVDSSMSETDIKRTINTYTQTFMPPGTDMSAWNDTMAKAYTTYDAKYPLTSHNGYTFGKWIEYTSEDFTVYGEAVDATSATTMVDIATPQDPDYTNISKGLVLKAAYIANGSMTSQTLSDPELRRYSFSNDPDPNEGYFGRYGTSSNYMVKVKVTRVNKDNNPIYRPRQTALRVSYKVESGTTTATILTLSKLENVDEQIAEVAVPDKATSVTFTVIDIGGVADWASSSAARSEGFEIEKDEYYLLGNVVHMNEVAETTDLTNSKFTPPSAAYFTAAGLSTTTVANATGNATEFRRQAVRNIAAAQTEKHKNEGKKYLTQEEMQNAITYGNYLGNSS